MLSEPSGLIGGPAVLLSAINCARFERAVVLLEREARLEGVALHPDLRALGDAIRQVGRAYRSQARSELDGMHGTPSLPPSVMVRHMTTKDVAEQLGCSSRNVLGLVARKSLPARRVARHWVFDAVDVADFIRSRQEAS